jgi:hypothetical protein
VIVSKHPPCKQSSHAPDVGDEVRIDIAIEAIAP